MNRMYKHRLTGIALVLIVLLGSAAFAPVQAGNGFLKALKQATKEVDSDGVKPKPLVDDSPIRPRLKEDKKQSDTADSANQKKEESKQQRRPSRRGRHMR